MFLEDSEVVTVLFQHTARDDDELTLNLYDKVTVLEKDDSGWWRGRLQDKEGLQEKEGLFPSRCVAGKYFILYIFHPWNFS